MEEQPEAEKTANPGYAEFQMAKALLRAEETADEGIRERAIEKVRKWKQVLEGMWGGVLQVGSRNPVQNAPVWATPEVVKGGFATGTLLAGGRLLPFELELMQASGIEPDGDNRLHLNQYYLTDTGFAKLSEMLLSGRYEIKVPEEGALLTAAWLSANGHGEKARNLVAELGPYFPRFRFYPQPSEKPSEDSLPIFRYNAGDVQKKMLGMKPNPQIAKLKEALLVWRPLHDRAIDLLAETVEGELPSLSSAVEGSQTGNTTGGWPCRKYPADWTERAMNLLKETEDATRKHLLCGKPRDPKTSISRTFHLLKKTVNDAASLNGKEVGEIRGNIAKHFERFGAPGSDRRTESRKNEMEDAGLPYHADYGKLVGMRLESADKTSGLPEPESFAAPANADEAVRYHVTADTSIPDSIVSKLKLCKSGSVETLVKEGIIPSADLLADILPQFTSTVKAASFPDPVLRRLYASVYRAFRKRRGLLLLNYAKQVQINELPWVSVLESTRRKHTDQLNLPGETLKQIAALWMKSFPTNILPNKLLTEFNSLAKDAKLNLPLTEELAADIFMGGFTDKFLHAADRAGELLGGSLYSVYYNIPFSELKQGVAPLSSPESVNPSTSSSPGRGDKRLPVFTTLCYDRAGINKGQYSVAANGTVIEQEQILTTHNLAVLYAELDLDAQLREHTLDLAKACFVFVCRRLTMKKHDYHSELIALKNSAYSWRQMIFFLSVSPQDKINLFIEWAHDHLAKYKPDFRARFAPVMKGLLLASKGISPLSAGGAEQGAKVFLGWTVGRHWLLPPRA